MYIPTERTLRMSFGLLLHRIMIGTAGWSTVWIIVVYRLVNTGGPACCYWSTVWIIVVYHLVNTGGPTHYYYSTVWIILAYLLVNTSLLFD